MVSLDPVLDLLAKHEGFRSTAYKDTKGFLTIGYGTNLDNEAFSRAQCAAVGLDYQALRDGAPITEDQARRLMVKAARHAIACASIRIHGFDNFPANVQLAVVDMIYNLGFAGFCEFQKLIGALERRDWAAAALEMKNSAWFDEVCQRAIDDIELVESAL